MLNLEETEKVAIACIATGARPAPQFKWYIGDQLYNQNINTSIENLQDDRATYTSTFNYIGNPKDIAHMLKCEVIHKGYTNQQLSDEDNLEEAQLNLSFKSDPDAKITCYQMEGNVDYKEISCYEMKNGKSSMVKIMFLANPKPTEGEWHVIGKKPIPTNSSIDNFSSSPISDGDLEGEYQVTLDFNMTSEIAAGNNFFKVTNNLGTTEIKFDFEITTSSTSSSTTISTTGSTTIIAPKCHETTFKGMQANQFSTVKIMLVANPEPTVVWHIDFGDNFDNSQISSSQIKNGADENSYFVESTFVMTEDLNRKNGSLEIFNSNGNVFCNFTLALQYWTPTVPPSEPPTEPPTRPPTGPETRPVTGPVTGPPAGPPTKPPTVPPSESPVGPSTVPPTSPSTLPPTLPPTGPTTVPLTELPTEPPIEPSIDQNPRYKPDIVSFTYHGFQNKENSIIEVIFRASPMPDRGYWYIGNTKVSFGTTEAQYLGESNVDEKFISSQVKNTEENLSDTYLVQLNFTMVPELEEKQCSFVVENSFGATNKTFQMPKIKLEPTPEVPTEPPAGPVTRPVIGPVTGPTVGPPIEPKIRFKPEIVNDNHTL